MGALASGKPLVRFASAVIAAALLALSIAGFDHLASNTRGTFEGQTTFGCMCFLGVCFGVLLTLAELNWSLFYYFFGFLRYRIGRAVVFAIAGIMIGLIGKNLDDKCDCKAYVVLIVEGVACVGMTLVQLVAIVLYGNNTKPVAPPPPSASYQPTPTGVGPTQPTCPSTSDAALASRASSPSVQTTPSADAPTSAAPAARSAEDPNHPAWMNA